MTNTTFYYEKQIKYNFSIYTLHVWEKLNASFMFQ